MISRFSLAPNRQGFFFGNCWTEKGRWTNNYATRPRLTPGPVPTTGRGMVSVVSSLSEPFRCLIFPVVDLSAFFLEFPIEIRWLYSFRNHLLNWVFLPLRGFFGFPR